MSRVSLLVLGLLAVFWWAMGSLGQALPPPTVVIQAGPAGGSFDAHARRYAALMVAQGLKTEVRNLDDSLQIIDRVNRAEDGVHIGFTAQHLDPQAHPHVTSAGVVEVQPLFVFLRRTLTEPATPAGLAGLRLAMPFERSATAQAAIDVLGRYGVTPQNTRFGFQRIGDAAAALQRGEFDAGFFMLAPDNPLIRRLAADPGLVLYPFSESVGISRNIDYLQPATVARGAFDLRAVQPPRDVALVGASVNVIVRDDLHPAVLYALLHAMAEVHQGQTLVSNAGQYPTQTGVVLPLHPLVAEWVKSGTPWLFTHLPPAVAGVVDAYWGPALVLLAVVSAFGTLNSLNDFIDGIVLRVALFVLARLHGRLQRGHQPGFIGRALFRLAEPVVVKQDDEELARARLEQLRPYVQR